MTGQGGHTLAIVAGVDGSESALHAVRWAAAEANRRHLPLRLVHGQMVTASTYPGMSAVPQGVYDDLLGEAREWLRQARDAALEVAPGLDAHTELADAPGTPALLDASATARMVVLGSRGLGGFTGLLVGSTAVSLAAHGQCPVTVVRGRTPGEPPPTSGPVVVGVDGSPAGEGAIGVAFDEASLRGVSLVAVHTWSDVTVGGVFDRRSADFGWEEIQADEQRLLTERLAGWQDKYPDLRVHRVVTRDRPVHSLLAQGENAQLLVVGSRGRGGFAGMVLGSTSQPLLHHAPCPVTVVRRGLGT